MVFDWTAGASGFMLNVIFANMRVAGRILATYIEKLQLAPNKLHLIGQSSKKI